MRIGVIGYGLRIQNIVEYLLASHEEVKLTAITDINWSKVSAQLAAKGRDIAAIAMYKDADEMLDKEQLDGVLIGTRCSLHTVMAKKVLQRNLPLYLEKPVATTMVDLISLKEAAERSASEVIVSFPLRNTALVRTAKEIVDSGKLGTIEHVQAINNVPYGGVYFHDWYRDEKETGGLFLQKSTHDFDYINHLLGIKPVAICAMKSKQIFKGNKPAGLYCKDCEEYKSCPESPYVLKHFKSEPDMYIQGGMCSFATDTGNEDSGSAIIQYETGMHVSYSQNFFARKGAEARGARLLGYKGTLEFDFYTEAIKVYMHNTPRVETYQLDSSQMSHGGGDAILVHNFIQVMKGEEKSGTPLNDGLLSALMCLKATHSSETHTFKTIAWE
ncbi:Gfo/Idh/MocA family protein [Paenibacillus sp. PAMC21692]|uniref:Gfo/Idh/MocA family protein n=1 Tax=Paenibacillus sp. PAMC21692 TaxID=2762320 RepID=UPI00164DDD95|nr:Gfo/Idh/MocA family oxidoreductase [Paenibacillus sp. PAMC21692]QNK56813.1 Gfo/Idh/MocA family oxidoreductase [Paenibacillus sp. PAMC21692]